MGFLSTAHHVHIALACIDFYLLSHSTTQPSYLSYEESFSIDENIDNYEYINTSILWIYGIYQRYIDKYFDTKYQQTQIDQNL